MPATTFPELHSIDYISQAMSNLYETQSYLNLIWYENMEKLVPTVRIKSLRNLKIIHHI